jgi:Ca2+-binding EF-hand superfamily protein
MQQQRAQRPLRRMLLAHFDRNHDGRLEPRERMRAAKALHKLANRLAKRDGRANDRAARKQKLIRRFDLDHDGNIGPGEMPPGLANELRPLDRDGDGWLQGNELP